MKLLESRQGGIHSLFCGSVLRARLQRPALHGGASDETLVASPDPCPESAVSRSSRWKKRTSSGAASSTADGWALPSPVTRIANKRSAAKVVKAVNGGAHSLLAGLKKVKAGSCAGHAPVSVASASGENIVVSQRLDLQKKPMSRAWAVPMALGSLMSVGVGMSLIIPGTLVGAAVGLAVGLVCRQPLSETMQKGAKKGLALSAGVAFAFAGILCFSAMITLIDPRLLPNFCR